MSRPATSDQFGNAREEWEYSLPRSEGLEGAELSVDRVEENGDVVITDGERSAPFAYYSGDKIDLTALRIVPAGVEAGYFTEAHVVTLTDGEGVAIYAVREPPDLD